MAKPTQLITKEFAIELNENYNNLRLKLIEAATGEADCNAVWYSLEELENYIAYIKSEAGAKGYTADGIRFYLGVYPTDIAHGDKSGKTTVFLSPTGSKATGPQTVSAQSSLDIDSIAPLNFGTVGDPPKIDYPLSH